MAQILELSHNVTSRVRGLRRAEYNGIAIRCFTRRDVPHLEIRQNSVRGLFHEAADLTILSLQNSGALMTCYALQNPALNHSRGDEEVLSESSVRCLAMSSPEIATTDVRRSPLTRMSTDSVLRAPHSELPAHEGVIAYARAN